MFWWCHPVKYVKYEEGPRSSRKGEGPLRNLVLAEVIRGEGPVS
jgi:hypothetical protein